MNQGLCTELYDPYHLGNWRVLGAVCQKQEREPNLYFFSWCITEAHQQGHRWPSSYQTGAPLLPPSPGCHVFALPQLYLILSIVSAFIFSWDSLQNPSYLLSYPFFHIKHICSHKFNYHLQNSHLQTWLLSSSYLHHQLPALPFPNVCVIFFSSLSNQLSIPDFPISFNGTVSLLDI